VETVSDLFLVTPKSTPSLSGILFSLLQSVVTFSGETFLNYCNDEKRTNKRDEGTKQEIIITVHGGTATFPRPPGVA
jgi:hypothetical protein